MAALPVVVIAPLRSTVRGLAPTTPPLVDFAVTGTADVLVFEHAAAGFSLIGGTGRGAGWAGIVELDPTDDSLVGRAWRTGRTCRLAGALARHVAGPYHARHAAAVPAGDQYVVVFGAPRPIPIRDPDLLRLAVAAIDRIHGVPADKLLADELELVHAVRALMAYRPENVRDTMRHVATIAAQSLSCEVAVIRVDHDGQEVIEAVNLVGRSSRAVGPAADEYLAMARLASGPAVEQAVSAGAGEDTFGIDIASRMAFPLGADPACAPPRPGDGVEAPFGRPQSLRSIFVSRLKTAAGCAVGPTPTLTDPWEAVREAC